MAAPPRTGRLFQDTNTYGPRKLRVSGRKPLSDVSNNAGNKPLDASAKPSVSVTRPSKQIIKSNLDNNNNNNNNNLSVIMNNEAVFVSSSAKAKNLEASNIRIASNTASGKSLTGGGGSRKVLSDISNTGKLPLLEMKEKKTLKSLREKEEPLSPTAIGEEMCRHDHWKCVEAHSKALDFRSIMNDFYRDMKVSAEPPLNIKIESDSELWESEEEPELSIPERRAQKWHWNGIGSPEHWNTEEHLELPSSPVNFELKEFIE